MSGFEAEEKQAQQVQRAPTAAAPTATTAEGAMHETRKNVTRHCRAAMRKESGKAAAGPQVDIPEGGGSPLPGGVKSTMEKKLGANLSDVKIHTGGDSANASEKLNAQAFTVGSDVHFNSGKFDPASKEGSKLLAHELTHVVQGQKGGVQKKEDEGDGADAEGKDGEALEVSDPDEPAEQEADAVADKATEDMGDGGAAEAAGGDEKAAGGEEEAAAGETEEQAPEAGAKLQAGISAKYNASALRKVLRKKAFRDPAAEDEEKKEPEAAGEASSSEGASAEAEAPAEAAAPEAGGEEKQEVAAKLQRKVFRDPAAAEGEEKKEPEAAGEASSSEGASAEAEAPAAAAAPEEAAGEEKKVAAKLKGVQRKVFRAAPAAGETPQQKFDREKTDAMTAANGVSSLSQVAGFLSALPASFCDNAAIAGSMISKLQTAKTEAKAAWAKDPATAADKETKFITSRESKANAVVGAAMKKAVTGATFPKKMDAKDAMWNIVSSDWGICAPEEDASSELMNRIGGCYKAFDAADFYTKMDPTLKAKWEASGGVAAWIGGVASGAKLPVAPPGKESDPGVKPFVDGAKPAFPGTVSGFISTAKALDDPKVQGADKATVLTLLGLQPGRYPSSKMILGKMGAAGAAAGAAGGAKLGKPSMFYLIAFPENIYKADNREHGETSGGEPELQTTNMPAQAFLDGVPMVKT